MKVEGHASKDRVSRGQQKLLAAGLTMAQLELQEAERPGRAALLLDDPAAELDDESLARLMARVRNLGCQVIATSLVPDSAIFGGEGAVFHVEHGELSRGS